MLPGFATCFQDCGAAILSHLDARTFFHARLVCKQWKHAADSMLVLSSYDRAGTAHGCCPPLFWRWCENQQGLPAPRLLTDDWAVGKNGELEACKLCQLVLVMGGESNKSGRGVDGSRCPELFCYWVQREAKLHKWCFCNRTGCRKKHVPALFRLIVKKREEEKQMWIT